MSEYTDDLGLSPELATVIDRDFMTLEREIDSLRHEVHTFEEAFKAADFRAVDYSQRILAAAAILDELESCTTVEAASVVTMLRAALKLGDT
jgi:hypothetical protein